MKDENIDIIKRLQRANGHLTRVIDMLTEGQDGKDIAQQMQAVSGAVSKAKSIFVLDQIEKQLSQDIKPESVKKDLQELAKYL